MDWLTEAVIPYGIFGSLFLGLLIYTNKRNESREKELQASLKDYKEQSDEREKKYHEMLDKSQVAIAEYAKAFTVMAADLKEMKFDIRKEREKR